MCTARKAEAQGPQVSILFCIDVNDLVVTEDNHGKPFTPEGSRPVDLGAVELDQSSRLDPPDVRTRDNQVTSAIISQRKCIRRAHVIAVSVLGRNGVVVDLDRTPLESWFYVKHRVVDHSYELFNLSGVWSNETLFTVVGNSNACSSSWDLSSRRSRPFRLLQQLED